MHDHGRDKPGVIGFGVMSLEPLRLRRRRYLLLRVGDEVMLDVERFLRGTIEVAETARCWILCPITRKAIAIDVDELAMVMTVPVKEWIDEAVLRHRLGEAGKTLVNLAGRGLLLSDPPCEGWEGLAGGERALDEGHWQDVAAVFHAHSAWEGVVGVDMLPKDDSATRRDHLVELRRERGEPPSPFFRREDASKRVGLRVPVLGGPFFETLLARRTTRAFETGRRLSLTALEELLFTVFGTHGIKQLAPDVSVIKRTSPSGGALHCIEAYVLAIRVEGIESGLYHYETASHELAELETMDVASARTLATLFTAGQAYFAEAHALVIHVARFERSFWKYARHRKAYRSVLMDSGHLSQTFYLTATHRGLGAFFTAAINDVDIHRRLRLTSEREAALGINGLGIVAAGRDELHFVPDPYPPVGAVP